MGTLHRTIKRHLLWVMMLSAAMAGLGLGLQQGEGPLHAASNCSTSGPASGAYTVTLCITAPTDGATLTGAVPVMNTLSFTLAPTGTLPGVQQLVTSLNNQYLLTDFSTAPFDFSLPTNQFADGAYALNAQALMNDGFTTTPAQVNVTFHNGNSQTPPVTNSFSPTSGTTPAAGQPFVVAAVGDGAGGETNETNVVNLVNSWNPNLFLYLGDVYNQGSRAEFYNWYGPDNFFGHLRPITDPTVGNHEYLTSQADGYFYYWNGVPNYYSFNAGGWHFISLNSNGTYVPTVSGSPQYQWLQKDLTAHSNLCTIAFYHHPFFNVGPELPGTQMTAIWSLLAQGGTSLVLNGHDHDYQRWVPLDGSGSPSQSGVTEFVVGSGGHTIQQFITTDSRLAVGYDKTSPTTVYGALQLQLFWNKAVYKYINTSGTVLDSGTVNCSRGVAPPPPTPNFKIYLPLITR